jgi:hypothetical protein
MEKLKKGMMTVFAVAILMTPVVSIAGDLEPSAAPAPTMKTLDQIPPTWSIKLPASERFVVLADWKAYLNAPGAVLDKETGLVWEKSPSMEQGAYLIRPWNDALVRCYSLNLGGRQGWHLPTIEQLASLVDIHGTSGVALPDGHPFTDMKPSNYWSATTSTTNPTFAWSVNFFGGVVNELVVKTNSTYSWCVRGGETYDAH